MKKQLRTDIIVSELSGNSAFFPGYKKQAERAEVAAVRPASSPSTPDTRSGVRTNGRTVERANARTGERPTLNTRVLARNSFDIYEDHMHSLRELAYKQKQKGQVGSMSAMVREALDEYVAKHSQD